MTKDSQDFYWKLDKFIKEEAEYKNVKIADLVAMLETLKFSYLINGFLKSRGDFEAKMDDFLKGVVDGED